MKRRIVFGCLLPLIIVSGLVWYGVRSLTHADPPVERLLAVDRGDIEIKVTETGTIEPLKKVEVKSKVAGKLAKLYVQEGDQVRVGQSLAEIDPTEINSQVAQMQAQLDGTKARYEQALRGVIYQKDQTTSGIRQSEEGLRSAQARLRAIEEENQMQPGLLASETASAAATLKSAQDNLTLLKNATHPQAIVTAKTGADEAKASAENARRNLERQQRLLAKGFVAEQVVDAAKSELAAATARKDQADKRLELIEEQNRLEAANAESRIREAQAAVDRARTNSSMVRIKQQDVLAQRAAVQQAQAALKLARASSEQDKMRQDDVSAARAAVVQLENQLREVQVRQGDTHLAAGMDGIITRRYVEQGELITSGVSTFSSGTPVLQIADLSRMLVKISVNEVDVHRIRTGLPVEITIDGAKGALFEGRVSKVAPAAVGSTNPGSDGGQQAAGQTGGVIRFAVEVVVDHPDPRLKPGMSAKCAIIIDRRRNVLRLPNNGVQGEGEKASVEIASQAVKDGKTVTTATKRPVTAGLRGDSFVEIISGLKQGEQVKPGIYTGPPRKSLDMDFK